MLHIFFAATFRLSAATLAFLMLASSVAVAEDPKTSAQPAQKKEAPASTSKSNGPSAFGTRGQIPEDDDYCDAAVPPCPKGCREDAANKICVMERD